MRGTDHVDIKGDNPASLYEAFKSLTTNREQNRGTIEVVQNKDGTATTQLKLSKHRWASGKVDTKSANSNLLRQELCRAVESQIVGMINGIRENNQLGPGQNAKLNEIYQELVNWFNDLINQNDSSVMRKGIMKIVENVEDLKKEVSNLNVDQLGTYQICHNLYGGGISLSLDEEESDEQDGDELNVAPNVEDNNLLIVEDQSQAGDDNQLIPAGLLQRPDDEKAEGAAEVQAPAVNPGRTQHDHLRLLKDLASYAMGSRSSEGKGGGKGYMALDPRTNTPLKFLTKGDERKDFEKDKTLHNARVRAYFNEATEWMRTRLLEVAGACGEKTKAKVETLLTVMELKDGFKFLKREQVASAITEIAKKFEAFKWKDVRHAGTLDKSTLWTYASNILAAKGDEILRSDCREYLSLKVAVNPEEGLNKIQNEAFLKLNGDENFKEQVNVEDFEVKTVSNADMVENIYEQTHACRQNPLKSMDGGPTGVAAQILLDENGKPRNDVALYAMSQTNGDYWGGLHGATQTSSEGQFVCDLDYTLGAQLEKKGYITGANQNDAEGPLYKYVKGSKVQTRSPGMMVNTKLIASDNSKVLDQALPINVVFAGMLGFVPGKGDKESNFYTTYCQKCFRLLENSENAKKIAEKLDAGKNPETVRRFTLFVEKMRNHFETKLTKSPDGTYSKEEKEKYREWMQALLFSGKLKCDMFAEDTDSQVEACKEEFGNETTRAVLIAEGDKNARKLLQHVFKEFFSMIRRDYESKNPDGKKSFVVELPALDPAVFEADNNICSAMAQMAILHLRPMNGPDPIVVFPNVKTGGNDNLMKARFESAFKGFAKLYKLGE